MNHGDKNVHQGNYETRTSARMMTITSAGAMTTRAVTQMVSRVVMRVVLTRMMT
jgi:hypothetical protein